MLVLQTIFDVLDSGLESLLIPSLLGIHECLPELLLDTWRYVVIELLLPHSLKSVFCLVSKSIRYIVSSIKKY